tara:strand:+ start:2465 stop:3511 length:1047 start_codon:yes stop_codon:yes gene_type:complete
MKSQKIFEYGAPLQEVNEETPTPHGKQILLRVIHCGVCHSDVHVHDGFFRLDDQDKLDIRARRNLPFTLGHEVFGEVVAIGPDVKDISIGDRRAVYPWIGCGDCPTCNRDEEYLCEKSDRVIGLSTNGGYSDHLVVPDPKYLLEVGGINPGLAATYMCSGLTAFAAINQVSGMGVKDNVLILGLGGVGMSGLQIARAILDANLFAADIDDTKLSIASNMGIETFNSSQNTCIRDIQRRTNGVTAVVDFVGSQDTAAMALKVIRRGGEYIIVGLYGGAIKLPLATVALRAISIKGVLTGSINDARAVISLARDGKLLPIPITERPLTDATNVLEDLKKGTVTGRVILSP